MLMWACIMPWWSCTGHRVWGDGFKAWGKANRWFLRGGPRWRSLRLTVRVAAFGRVVGACFFCADGSCERRCRRVQRGGRGSRRGTRVIQAPEGVPQGPAAGARHPEHSRVGAGRSPGKVEKLAGSKTWSRARFVGISSSRTRVENPNPSGCNGPDQSLCAFMAAATTTSTGKRGRGITEVALLMAAAAEEEELVSCPLPAPRNTC